MRAFIMSVVLWLCLPLAAVADAKEIQSVIDRQLEAFQADDFAQAMEYASPGLQRYFGTPERFGQMVTQGYPMVWRPAEVQYLETRQEGDSQWQRVMIRDTKGTVHILEYRMLETPDGWRINGVQILDAADYTT